RSNSSRSALSSEEEAMKIFVARITGAGEGGEGDAGACAGSGQSDVSLTVFHRFDGSPDRSAVMRLRDTKSKSILRVLSSSAQSCLIAISDDAGSVFGSLETRRTLRPRSARFSCTSA